MGAGMLGQVCWQTSSGRCKEGMTMGGTQIRMTGCAGTLVELAGGREAGRRAGSSLTAESGAPGVKCLMKGGGRGAVRRRGGGLGSNKWPTPEREGLQKGKSIYRTQHYQK